MSESLDKIVGGIRDFLSGNCLKNWKEFFKGNSVIGFLTLDQFPDIGFRRVLAEGSKDFANLFGLMWENNILKTILFPYNVLCHFLTSSQIYLSINESNEKQ